MYPVEFTLFKIDQIEILGLLSQTTFSVAFTNKIF